MGVKKVRTTEGFLRSGPKTKKECRENTTSPHMIRHLGIVSVWSFRIGKKCSAFIKVLNWWLGPHEDFGIFQCGKFYNVGPTYLPFKTPLMSDSRDLCIWEPRFMTIFVTWRWTAFAILPGAVFRQHFKFCSRQSSVNTKNPRIESFSWMFQSAHNLKLHLDRAGKVLRRPLAGLGWVTMAAAASYFGTSH